jgi:transcriptional regulator with XRE-family HTH domain
MSSFLLVVLSVLISLGVAAAGDMVSQEIRDRLDHLPYAILRLAAYRLDPSKRVTVYVVEWIPELTYILRGDEARPVTRLYHGMRFAIGILVAVRRIDRHLQQAEMAPDPPHALPLAESKPLPSQSGTRSEQGDSDDRQRQPKPTAQRFVLGSNLRRLREAAGITMDQAAAVIRSASATIYQTEHGLVHFKERDIADLLSLYGVESAAERGALMRLAREVDSSGWWQVYSDTLPHWTQPYFDLEAAAWTIREFEVQFVPPLLQTEEYARAVICVGNCPSEPFSSCFKLVSLQNENGLGDLACAPGAAA